MEQADCLVGALNEIIGVVERAKAEEGVSREDLFDILEEIEQIAFKELHYYKSDYI